MAASVAVLGTSGALAGGVDPDVAVVHVRPAPPGFVEVPDDGAAEPSISIEAAAPPRTPAPRHPVLAVVPRPPAPRAVAATPAIATPRPAVDPMIDGQAPPLAVLISFSKDRPHARLQADALAQTLRGLGVTVDEAAVSGVAVRTPRIGYVFTPDRPAALAISVNAGAQYGFVDPVSLPISAVPEARPGLIAIMLPG